MSGDIDAYCARPNCGHPRNAHFEMVYRRPTKAEEPSWWRRLFFRAEEIRPGRCQRKHEVDKPRVVAVVVFPNEWVFDDDCRGFLAGGDVVVTRNTDPRGTADA